VLLLLVGPAAQYSDEAMPVPVLHIHLDLEAGTSPPTHPKAPQEGAGLFAFDRRGGEIGIVRRSWKAIQAEVESLRDYLGIGREKGVGLYFDQPTEQTAPLALAALGFGGRLFLPDAGEPPDGWELDNLVEEGSVDLLVAGSQTLDQLVNTGWEARIELVLSGDSAMPETIATAVRERCNRLHLGWGAAPVAGWALSTDGAAPPGENPLLFHRIHRSAHLRIMDASGNLLPQGVPGRLWIGAPSSASELPELHGNPAPEGVTEGLDSGDLLFPTHQSASWVPDGRLRLGKRLDRVELLDGHWVDLASVDAGLEDLGTVREAYTLVEEIQGQRRLVGHIVVEAEGRDDEEELRGAMKELGPSSQAPVAVMVHSALPRDANGVVDEALLRVRSRAMGKQRAGKEPKSQEEVALARVWMEVLAVDEVSTDENFFDLGGHSLLAIQATVRLEEEEGLRIDPRSLFFQPLSQVAAGAVRLS
jgi:hypothetical protein